LTKRHSLPKLDLKDENPSRTLPGVGNKVEATDKDIALAVLGRMRDDSSLHDIVQELEFVAAVQQGMSELDENNDSVSIEKFEPKAPSWTVTIGRKRRRRQKRKAGEPLKTGDPLKTKAGDSLKPPAPSPST
jgi:hypothetical protein